MPILNNWKLELSIDQVLRAQGADPESIKSRSPALIKTTQEAINQSRYLLQPTVLFEKYGVERFIHDRLELNNSIPNHPKNYLSGKLIAEHLSQAHEVIILLCTIGNELDQTISSLFNINPVSALAMDGVGSAAVELLAIQACNYFEELARQSGYKTSLPLNPGMIGWPVEVGQPQIFTLLDSEEINVSITESCMMVPNKSLSIVLGVGSNFSAHDSPCEFCSLKGVCRYQNHYAKPS